jgi:Fe-S-cluster containining protein
LSNTKICLRSGQCCSSHFALVPKHEQSNLNPAYLDAMDDPYDYIEENSEMMGTPCRWLIVDDLTAEATCKAHDRKSSMCIDHPEDIGVGSRYCHVGLAFWRNRKSSGKQIPKWVDKILIGLGK